MKWLSAEIGRDFTTSLSIESLMILSISKRMVRSTVSSRAEVRTSQLGANQQLDDFMPMPNSQSPSAEGGGVAGLKARGNSSVAIPAALSRMIMVLVSRSISM